MRQFLSKLLDRLFAVAGAFLFCQLPLFIKEYQLLLAGHLAECRLQLQELEKVAGLGHKTLSEYIQKFLSQSDTDFVRQAEWMERLQSRTEELSQANAALQETSLWTKPFVFLTNLDKILFHETLQEFTPGLTATFETLVYAICGIGAAVLCCRLILHCIKAVGRCFKR